jgi:predicted nucleotide-binding protein (sugar kinase/HSP70/actin superfamily)
MNIVIPKVQKWQLNEFLQTLHPETIAEMWMRLCDYHRYNYIPFQWCELVDMILKNPNVVGIDLVDSKFDCGKSSAVVEFIEDYLSEFNGEDIGF